jgi:shikimate kinase
MSVSNIILIGPMGVGKSSAAKALANITGLEYIDVDEMRWDYFSSQPDFNGEMVDKLFDDSREAEAFSYMKKQDLFCIF